MKIMLDPGHYGKYNQSPANKSYYESEAMWKLTQYLKSALETYGIMVGVTRTNANVDRPVFERGKAAKGYDLFISLHSNAVGGGVNESTDYPVVYVPLNKKGDAIGNKLATIIEKTMNTKQKGRIATRKGSAGTDYYGVIRGAVSVGVVGILLEHSFHTQTKATNWLLSDANLKRLANAEADVIAAHYGIKKAGSIPEVKPQPPTASKMEYKVGDIVDFKGGSIYASSSAAKTTTTKGASRCKVTQVYNGKHPYHLISEDGKGVYGWVDAKYIDTKAKDTSYMVRVDIADLNIRKGPGTNYGKGGYTGKGSFTIVEEANGPGATKWGLLRSYQKNRNGWISLDYTKKI